jgi:hypothetical protein
VVLVHGGARVPRGRKGAVGVRCRCRQVQVGKEDDTTSRTGSRRRSGRKEERVAKVEGKRAQ